MHSSHLDYPMVTLTLKQHNNLTYLDYEDEIKECLNEPVVRVKVENAEGMKRIYTVFAQNDMAYQNAISYGDYSEYMKLHGCACCSLTAILTAMRPSKASFMPQDTILNEEKTLLPRWEFEKNYGKPIYKQMPVTLYGITQILKKEAIQCRYIASFKRREALEVIDRHLSLGNPVVFETSKIRYKNGIIVSVNDKKYAGSYHTMIMLGYDKDKNVIFTDSANRSWAGELQRLKKAELPELMNYMFPQRKTENQPLYFHGRSSTGGFIMLYPWDRIENLIQKNIDKMTFVP